MNKEDLLALIRKYLAGNASNEEMDRLSRYYNSFQHTDGWNESELGSEQETTSRLFNRIREEIATGHQESNAAFTPQATTPGLPVPPVKERRGYFGMVRVAVAASVIGLVMLGAYLWLDKGFKKEQTKNTVAGSLVKRDVLPGSNKAVLTLADGTSIVLDDAQNGDLARQGNTRVIKLNGRLAYDAAKTGSGNMVYNTITTPRGGQYQVELPDGSQVWLNAESSIHFPTAFPGKERQVEITGEAYFEVAKQAGVPFTVRVNGAAVQVLGTHFDVMAYDDEAALKTTLLEGSVQFAGHGVNALLKPGQQSQLTKDGRLNVENNVEVEDVVAWKNGAFHLEDADIQTVMRQLSRWYDVEVVYKNNDAGELFYLEMPRSSTLSDVLRVLELAGNIHFQLNGKKIMVLP